MRDPNRIETILEALQLTWQQEPDLRLGQLLINITKPQSPCPELFYLEDDELLQYLNQKNKGA